MLALLWRVEVPFER